MSWKYTLSSYGLCKFCPCFPYKGKIIQYKNCGNTTYGAILVILYGLFDLKYTNVGCRAVSLVVLKKIAETCKRMASENNFLGLVYNNFVKLIMNQENSQIKYTANLILRKLI